jgi:hypothetical protein
MSYHDTTAGTGGGSNGNGTDQNIGATFGGQSTTPFTKFVESPFKWTDPPRWFKANDPYWYKLDNLPLKQIHENCQWLKDQLQVALLASGINRVDINELRPYAVGSDRRVRVLPGNYLGRVNDAYNKGISTYTELNEGTLSFDADTFAIVVTQQEGDMTLRDNVLATLIGYNVQASSSFPANGLYDYLQHHQVTKLGVDSIENVFTWGAGQDEENPNNQAGMANIPKIKLSVWNQVARPESGDLQQRAVDFTRRWGGVFRTSMVNIADTISVSVPEFSDGDYINSADYVPHIRIDLVFIYTHPVDSKQTTLAEPNGDAPVVVTAPILGIVKGAGVVALKNQGGFSDELVDIQSNPTLTDTEAWKANSTSPSVWYDSDGEPGYSEVENAWEIRSPLSDQVQEVAGVTNKNVFASLPSPDDLLNLAPLIQSDLEEEDFALIGQSILPVAYVMVKKGASIINSDDIIDIRPFFRTAELTYNERAGVAAALPPLSLANPAVGKEELYNILNDYGEEVHNLVTSLTDVEGDIDVLEDTIADLATSSLTNAFVFGNVNYGPGNWEFQKRRGGGGWTAGYNKYMKIAVDSPNASMVTAQIVLTQKPPTQHPHRQNDGDQRFRAKLIFMVGTTAVQSVVSTSRASMGHSHNGQVFTLSIGAIQIPFGVDSARLRVVHSSNQGGDNENEDTVAADVVAHITVMHAVKIESVEILGS